MNAKEEFVKHVGDKSVLCARITLGSDYWEEDERKTFSLKTNYSNPAYHEFLSSLDFDYDSGYGGQELYGTIWYTDGTWSERCEYDGSEWWEYKRLPEIPDELKV